jgi:hypothetical protein
VFPKGYVRGKSQRFVNKRAMQLEVNYYLIYGDYNNVAKLESVSPV